MVKKYRVLLVKTKTNLGATSVDLLDHVKPGVSKKSRTFQLFIQVPMFTEILTQKALKH